MKYFVLLFTIAAHCSANKANLAISSSNDNSMYASLQRRTWQTTGKRSPRIPRKFNSGSTPSLSPEPTALGRSVSPKPWNQRSGEQTSPQRQEATPKSEEPRGVPRGDSMRHSPTTERKLRSAQINPERQQLGSAQDSTKSRRSARIAGQYQDQPEALRIIHGLRETTPEGGPATGTRARKRRLSQSSSSPLSNRQESPPPGDQSQRSEDFRRLIAPQQESHPTQSSVQRQSPKWHVQQARRDEYREYPHVQTQNLQTLLNQFNEQNGFQEVVD